MKINGIHTHNISTNDDNISSVLVETRVISAYASFRGEQRITNAKEGIIILFVPVLSPRITATFVVFVHLLHDELL